MLAATGLLKVRQAPSGQPSVLPTAGFARTVEVDAGDGAKVRAQVRVVDADEVLFVLDPRAEQFLVVVAENDDGLGGVRR